MQRRTLGKPQQTRQCKGGRQCVYPGWLPGSSCCSIRRLTLSSSADARQSETSHRCRGCGSGQGLRVLCLLCHREVSAEGTLPKPPAVQQNGHRAEPKCATPCKRLELANGRHGLRGNLATSVPHAGGSPAGIGAASFIGRFFVEHQGSDVEAEAGISGGSTPDGYAVASGRSRNYDSGCRLAFAL